MELRIKKLHDVESEQKKKGERAKKAQDRKKQSTETLEEAWQRIFSQKNSDADLAKLREVKAAMDAGKIGRQPEDMFNKKGTPKKFSKAEAKRLYEKLREMRRKEILENMKANVPSNYELIQEKTHLDEFLTAMNKEDEIVFDVETTGTDVWEDEIVGIALTLPQADRHAYIPTNHETDEKQLDREYVLKRLEPYFNDKHLKKVAHNGKFDIHMLNNHGIKFRNLYFDTQTAMHVLNENEPTKRLKDLVTKYLKIDSQTYDELFGKQGFHKVSDLRVALAYAAKDGDITWKLKEFQKFHLERVGLLDYYMSTEAPLTEVIVKMERAGFIIDEENAEKIGKQLLDEIENLLRELREIFGVDEEFNFNSPAQLTDLLFEKLKLHKKLPKGVKVSTDKRVLKRLKEHHEGIAKLLDYKEKTKLYGTYIDALPKKVRKDGRLHGEFNQDTTVTGRFSSNNPNLQNQPKYARKIFKAPAGMVLLSGDFSQQEPRLLAHFSKEPLLVEAYREGKDLYSAAAAELFGLPIEECGDGSKWRKMLKTGILAVMYGTGAKTLGEQLGISTMEAQAFINDFYNKYRYVKAWQEELVEYARKNGYVPMLFGRKRRVPEIRSRDEWEVYRAERQVKNSVIQGSAAIQTKKTMLNLDAWCEEKPEERTLALQVHDEVGCYVPDTITPEEVREFENIMLTSVELDVPNKTDIEAAYVWGDGLDWDTKKGLWIAKDDKHVIGEYRTPREGLAALEEYRKGKTV